MGKNRDNFFWCKSCKIAGKFNAKKMRKMVFANAEYAMEQKYFSELWNIHLFFPELHNLQVLKTSNFQHRIRIIFFSGDFFNYKFRQADVSSSVKICHFKTSWNHENFGLVLWLMLEWKILHNCQKGCQKMDLVKYKKLYFIVSIIFKLDCSFLT